MVVSKKELLLFLFLLRAGHPLQIEYCMPKELRTSYSIFIRHYFDNLKALLEDTLGGIGNMLSLLDH